MKLALMCLALVFSFNSEATNLRVKKVKTIGVMKNKVIFQGTNLKKVRNTNYLQGKIVAQWGTQVFEVLTGYYSCNKKDVCTLAKYETVATFQKCTVSKNKRVRCSRPLGSGSAGADLRGDVTYENPDEVYDEYNNNRNHYDSYDEFPARDNSGGFDGGGYGGGPLF